MIQSLTGKEKFKEALGAGTLEGFFLLIEQFNTQDEPAFCGLASLAMVLNTLQIDPVSHAQLYILMRRCSHTKSKVVAEDSLPACADHSSCSSVSELVCRDDNGKGLGDGSMSRCLTAVSHLQKCWKRESQLMR